MKRIHYQIKEPEPLPPLKITSGTLEVPIFVIPVAIFFYFNPALTGPGMLLLLAAIWFIANLYFQMFRDLF